MIMNGPGLAKGCAGRELDLTSRDSRQYDVVEARTDNMLRASGQPDAIPTHADAFLAVSDSPRYALPERIAVAREAQDFTILNAIRIAPTKRFARVWRPSMCRGTLGRTSRKAKSPRASPQMAAVPPLTFALTPCAYERNRNCRV